MHFYHSSPGTGTRDAQIDLKKLPPAEKVIVILSWSPEETRLNVGPKSPGGELVSATGSVSSVQLRVGDDGGVYSTGNQHIKIMGLNIFKGGKAIIEPTALDAWKETVQVMEILATGQSTEGYIYEAALASSTIVLLVTGFEAYARKRFIELEEEGVNPNMERLFEAFFSNKEREAGIQKVRDEEAQVAGVSTLKHIVGKKGNQFSEL